MIATNETNTLPAVLFPVCWPASEWASDDSVLERVRSSVSHHWKHVAPLVELARTGTGAGVLRVTLATAGAVSVSTANGEMFMVANACAMWMDETPPSAMGSLSASALADLREPPTENGVTVVTAVLNYETERAYTDVGRVKADRTHAEWLAKKLTRSPDCLAKPVWIVSVAADDIAGLVEELAT